VCYSLFFCFQRSIEKQRITHCQNSSKVNRKTKNNTLSEQFKGQ
jgi:hypothetical protein